ncbi:oligopeptide ABC transporter ATP-binding protein OppD [Mycoplasma putrefaciens]|uniref:Oligopeptide ABC transporter ATP-binding component n=1 Tax=Mycoplasma putrefaciens (strain ATCC 15718 / NCTC 10155 / C30 KS-1 / KS-1) TaxID=743965 RepID=A0A7U3ZT22_MYCPK|nr:oligopeptide ABC transporter ATP-binding protein OppD [Mycoplasma putrefaciens]AEM68986.1 Oligopeptide ABC transporter ATP-binding component [Mycoplasma putrefaciens KS1]
MKQKVILSIKDLVVKFRVRSQVLTSIRNISFDIYDGETIAIVGESGSGKSVFTKTLTNMLEDNGYIANGSITYYPNQNSNQSWSNFSKETNLVDFHKNNLENNSRKQIRKHNQLKIKELQAQTKNLQTITVDTINFKIQELETKIQELKKYEFTKNNRQLAKRDSYIKEVAELNKQIELLKNPKKLDFKIQELQRTINKLKQENANFQSVSIFKKIQYYQIINYITKNKDDLEYDLNLANKYLDKLANIEFKNDFESLILEILTDISKQTKKLDKAKIESLLELWNFIKLPNFIIKKKTSKSLEQLRGGTIATIFQDPMTSLNPLLSVGFQISEVLRLHNKLSRSAAKAEAINLMKKVGIPNAEKRYKDLPRKYSGGMRQRIVIAIALACRPKILICDEPTTALDVTIQAQVLDLIKELKKEYKFTVIFITHDLGVVANVADRVAVMYAGQIIEYGTINEIFFNSQHPYTWSLLLSLPQLGKKGEDLYSISGTPPSLFKQISGDAFAPRNQFALAIDYKYEPIMFKVSDTHYAKTWLLDPRAPKIDRPKQLEMLKDAVKQTKVGE